MENQEKQKTVSTLENEIQRRIQYSENVIEELQADLRTHARNPQHMTPLEFYEFENTARNLAKEVTTLSRLYSIMRGVK